jgi:antibiotic biosynthesis monooxygenase (ABM) superfamily enzyme
MSSPHKKALVIPITLSDVRATDEYQAEANKIKDVYLDKPHKMKPGSVAPAPTLRERILRMSLFPNVFNAPAHHRSFEHVRVLSPAENLVRHRTAKERKDGLDF